MAPLAPPSFLCEYPAELNESALGFERRVEGDVPPTPPRATSPPPPPEEEEPVSRRLTRSAAAAASAGSNKGATSQQNKKRPRNSAIMKRKQQKQKAKRETTKIEIGTRCNIDAPCASSILGDDLILCRLSSLLPPADYDNLARSTDADNHSKGSTPSNNHPTTTTKRRSRRIVPPRLVRKVSSSDVSMDGFDSCDSDVGEDRSSVSSGGFSLIPGDLAVVLPPELRHPDEAASAAADGETESPLQNLLRAVGLEEVEALDPSNGGPSAGQCQFACIASALSRSFGAAQPLRGEYRPDLELRRLALHVIRMNPDLYRNFLTVAGGRTRKHSQAGGASVDIDAYIRAMSNPSCDGDAVTLQALCDALKIVVRIVKPVAADSYDEERQKRLLREYHAPSGIMNNSMPSSSTSSPDASSDEEYDTAVEDVDDVSSASSTASLATAFSSLSWSDNPYSSCTGIRKTHHIRTSAVDSDNGENMLLRQRLYVSQEIRPRRLARIDTRIRDVQKISRGRLIWLSHIGDEAHYRYLRPMSFSSCASASDCPHGPVNEEEATIARRSHEQRHRRLDDLLRSREDGYIRPYKPQGYGRSRSNSIENDDFDIVSNDKILRLKKVCNEPNQSPRCGLCFQGFFTGKSTTGNTASASANTNTSPPNSPLCAPCSPVSPSGCDHDFCRSCIQTWAVNVSPTCPTCGCRFMDLIDQNQRVVTARSVTPSIDDDDCNLEMSSEQSSRWSTTGAGPRTSPLTPPCLPASFAWSDALAPSASNSAVKNFNREMLEEIGNELRCDGEHRATDAAVLIRFMGQLATMVDGEQLRNLLAANILSTLRLLLTPTNAKSTVRGVRVSIPGRSQKLYILSGEIFRAALAIIERINQKCAVGSKDTMLSMAILRDSLDLPKMLLWYVSRSELKNVEGYSQGLGCARRVLAHWSKQHCLSIVEALQKCGSLEAAEKKLEASKKRALAASAISSNPSKKSKTTAASTKPKPAPRATFTTSSAVPAPKPKPQKKAAAIPPKPRVLPKIPPPAPIQRGAGKRVIRPVVCVNISREEMSLMQYRQE